MEKYEKVLATVCFNCCKKSAFGGLHGSMVRQNRHPELGGHVELKGACTDCPIAVIRGDGAPISEGQKDKCFGFLVPGPDCEQKLTPAMTWLPCRKCAHATVVKQRHNEATVLKNLDFCIENCPLKEIRDCLDERYAEAGLG